ncbi:MAG TPA: hypothetical protein VJN18_29880 [Polyangiaceae bacterium]|nr:hypothetical protein [Polyangiaceae bacterium]
MKLSKLGLAGLTLLVCSAAAACNDDDGSDGDGVAGKAGAGSAGIPATGGSAGNQSTGGSSSGKGGGAATDEAGAGGVTQGGESGAGGDGPVYPVECGDPSHDGVLVYEDITGDATWSCPVYTLTRPIYVYSSNDTPVVLHIDPGVTVRGVKGLEPIKLPGALIVTRSARIEALGTEQQPIVFTTSEPAASATPGSWGGLMLLGRAPTNAPANFESSGKPAGELYAEALPKSDLSLYGWPRSSDEGAAGAGGAGGAGPGLVEEYPDWDCGKLKYVRIAFAGFKAGATKELNGLTLGACGTGTLVDHVQVHRSSDDGIEVFGGTVNLSYIVLTGNQDDSLDWDQGWRGKAQFVAIQSHDDADIADSCGIEADGFATPEAPLAEPSAPRIFNLTLIASKNTQRGIRFRDGTQVFLGNTILAAHAMGVPQGLVDIDHVRTADYLAAGKLAIQHSVFGSDHWPTLGQIDTQGTTHNEEDVFTAQGGLSATGNTVIGAATELWLNAFNTAQPQWVPLTNSAADEAGVAPSDIDGSTFFDTSATYRGAFEPGGEDWTAGWTSYP